VNYGIPYLAPYPDRGRTRAHAHPTTTEGLSRVCPYAGLPDEFHDDPRILEAGLAAAGLYACCTTYCGRHLTDGFVPRKAVARMLEDGDAAPLDALLRVKLLRLDGNRYEVVDYLKVNRTREQVEEAKAKAKAAADKRWRTKRRDDPPGGYVKAPF
jgi:hypothetical protein